MTYTIVDTDLDFAESEHPTLDAALKYMREQCIVKEYRGGKVETRRTTFGLHHRIRDDTRGAWIDAW